MDGELKGVKGWLLVFVIIMAVVSPLVSAVSVYVELYTGDALFLPDIPEIMRLKLFTWGLVVADAVIGWIAVYRLLTVHNWLSVQIAIACVWLGSVGLLIAGLIGLNLLTGLDVSDLMAQSGPRGLIQPFGFALIWTAYLLKSERVANTYRGGGEQAEVFE